MTSRQLDLFATIHSPMIVRPCDPDGEVIQGEVDEVHILPHPRFAWDRARIELHQHTDGLWMWSASAHTNYAGSGYRVGPKRGRFAETRDDALHYAREEITKLIARHGDEKCGAQITTWARGLQ